MSAASPVDDDLGRQVGVQLPEAEPRGGRDRPRSASAPMTAGPWSIEARAWWPSSSTSTGCRPASVCWT